MDDSSSEKGFLRQGLEWIANHTYRKLFASSQDKTDNSFELSYPYLFSHPQKGKQFVIQKLRRESKGYYNDQNPEQRRKNETNKNRKSTHKRVTLQNNIMKHKNKDAKNNSMQRQGSIPMQRQGSIPTHNQSSKLQKQISKYWKLKTPPNDRPMQLVCPICMDFFIYAVTTPCGHTFCLQCMDQAVLFFAGCPVCRTYIRGHQFIPCRQLNAVVLKYLSKYTLEEEAEESAQDRNQSAQDRSQSAQDRSQRNIYRAMEFRSNKNRFIENECQLHYKRRTAQFQKWRELRQVDPKELKAFDLVDVRDTEYIWCVAIVKELYYNNKNHHHSVYSQSISSPLSSLANGSPAFARIHYIGWSTIYDEIIALPSQRLTTYKFYTARKDLPRYDLQNDNDEHVYSYVVVDSMWQDVYLPEPQPEINDGHFSQQTEALLNQEQPSLEASLEVMQPQEQPHNIATYDRESSEDEAISSDVSQLFPFRRWARDQQNQSEQNRDVYEMEGRLEQQKQSQQEGKQINPRQYYFSLLENPQKKMMRLKEEQQQFIEMNQGHQNLEDSF